jgi:hypothetical protein
VREDMADLGALQVEVSAMRVAQAFYGALFEPSSAPTRRTPRRTAHRQPPAQGGPTQ